jgi:hypothetical protein
MFTESDQPSAAWEQIVLADKENVDQMRLFYSRKKVNLEDNKNVKNSCLHRVLSCVSSFWDAIEKTRRQTTSRGLQLVLPRSKQH